MDSSSSSSTNVPDFAQGLHVMVVDPDVTNLMYMKVLLQICSYRVTMVDSATTALSMILEKTGNFDIVIVEVAMPEIDGFKFLHRIRLQDKIPIVLMASNFETGMAARAFSLGACGFLKKPISLNNLTGIWHHVFTKTLEPSNTTGQTESFSGLANAALESSEAIETEETEVDESDGELAVTDIKRIGDKGRIVWTPELHRKFRFVVSELGEINAKPQQILKTMNVPNLTLRHVASHLQKYRKRARETGIVPPVLESMSNMPTPNVGNGPSLEHSNLSNSMGGGNILGRNSSLMPTQNFGNAQCQKLLDSPYPPSSIGGRNTTSAIPKEDFINIECLWDSPNMPNSVENLNNSSVMRTQDFRNGQPQKTWWGSSSLSNSTGGLNTVRNSWTTPAQTLTYGQPQTLGNSPYLSSYLGGLNTNTGNSMMVPSQNFQNGQSQKVWDSTNLLPTHSFSFAPRLGLFDLLKSWNPQIGLYQPQPDEGSSAGYLSSTFLKEPENCNSSNADKDQSVLAGVVAEDFAQTNVQEESRLHPPSVQLAEGVAKVNPVEESMTPNRRLSAIEKGKGILRSDAYEGWVDAGVDLTSELVDSLQESSADHSAAVIADELESMMTENNFRDLDQVLHCIMEENDSHELQVQELSPALKGLAQDTGIMREDFIMGQEGSSKNHKDLNDVNMEPRGMEGSDVPYIMEVSDEPDKEPNTIEESVPNKGPKSTEGSFVTNLEPNSMEGPDVPNKEPKTTEGSDVQTMKPNSAEGSDAPSCSKPQEQELWRLEDMMDLLSEDARFEEWLKLSPNSKYGFIQ